jgi:uridine kinase
MYLIAIAGGSGSGKTTFANKILTRFSSEDVVLLHLDNYYLDRQSNINFIESKPNFDSPQAFDWGLFHKQLSALKNAKTIKAPLYDFEKSRRKSDTLKIASAKVVLVEGILTLWDEKIRELCDLKIYLKVESDIRFIRRLHRDVEERGRDLDDIIAQYYRTVRPMHLKYTQPTQQFSDFIVGEHHDQAAEVIAHQIESILRKK